MSNYEAKALAAERGLDLVEVNPSSRPPICRLMDYGRYKYELAKKEKENKQKQKGSELKEIRLTFKISDHDMEYKAKQAREFIDDGNKVRATMRLRGRENIFGNEAQAVFYKFAEIAGLSLENNPSRQGNQISAMLIPKKEEKE